MAPVLVLTGHSEWPTAAHDEVCPRYCRDVYSMPWTSLLCAAGLSIVSGLGSSLAPSCGRRIRVHGKGRHLRDRNIISPLFRTLHLFET
jgi:hypothetical protein